MTKKRFFRDIIMIILGSVFFYAIKNFGKYISQPEKNKTIEYATDENQKIKILEKLGYCVNDSTKINDGEWFNLCDFRNITFMPLLASKDSFNMFLIECRSVKWCGSGGCVSDVYVKGESGYEKLQPFFGKFIRRLESQEQGVYDIEMSNKFDVFCPAASKVNSFGYCSYKYKWDSKERKYIKSSVVRISNLGGQELDLEQLKKCLLSDPTQ